MNRQIGEVARDNLTARVYNELRTALMEGRFWPGHRFKIRELAAAMNVSETPVREAVMQLVCEKGLVMEAARSIRVAELSLDQYLELRSIRLHLEGMAAEAAAARIDDRTIRRLRRFHEDLIDAEDTARWPEAVRANWDFHHTLYGAAAMPELLAIIETIWLRNGPLVNYHYPHARPTYPKEHQHLAVLRALEKRDAAEVRNAIQADLVEGGARLVKLLGQIEAGEVDRAQLRAESERMAAEAGAQPAPRPKPRKGKAA